MIPAVQAAIEEIRRGGIVVAADDEARENEGDLIMAAQAVTTDKMGFFLRHTSGVICASLTSDRCDVLAPAFNRPGHVFPLRARPGGVLKRAGHTEAAVDLARLAGR
ncbi:MAG TPA: 3,4-dihydroxy-2-butanone-4-phosphate synthase, partial [Conexibacter sp.]|nr:3,4-dihydroxy-2-butanone-4-phosphate synthase [Conexibacter sp.]